MTSLSKKYASTSLHRALILRIAAMTAVICLLLASIVYLNQRASFGRQLTERSLLGVAHLRVMLLSELDAPGLGDHARIQSTLNDLSKFGYKASSGDFVLLRILDSSYLRVASVVDSNYPYLKTVEELLSVQGHLFAAGESSLWHKIITVGGKPCIHMAMPLLNSRNEVVAYAESVFAVSDSAVAEIRQGTLRSLLYAILIVLATAALLYPVINRLMKKIAILTMNLLEANLETINVLGSAIAKRDSDTDLHNYRVTIYAVSLAERLGLSKSSIRSLIKGAFLHDVGKIGIRDDILLKPGKLDEDEFREMKLHVQHGRDILSRAAWLGDALDVVLSHHEKFDGGGYPLQQGKEEIPIAARLFAVIDVFDALTSHRPYKEPITFERTMEILEEGRGSHFDPLVLDAFNYIAAELYREYANSDEAYLKESLNSIAMRYFTGDIGDLLNG